MKYICVILNLISKYEIDTLFALDRVRIELLKHCLITTYVCFNPTCLTMKGLHDCDTIRQN